MRIPEEFNCNRCKKQRKCKELCPPMEKYAAQDEIEPGREKPLPPEAIGIRKFPAWPDDLSRSETIFQLYFFDRIPVDEIAKQLYIHRSNVYRAVTSAKQDWLRSLKNRPK
jgi:hypothetical protein